jgi:hypothetical protein
MSFYWQVEAFNMHINEEAILSHLISPHLVPESKSLNVKFIFSLSAKKMFSRQSCQKFT